MTEDAHAPDAGQPQPLRGHVGLPLTRLVQPKTLQELQERFAVLGQVTVCICSVYGELITKPTWGSRFSELLGTSLKGWQAFLQHVRDCCLARSSGGPPICHEGMTFYAATIGDRRRLLGLIVVGSRLPVPPPPDEIREMADRHEIDHDALIDSVSTINPYSGGTPEAIRRFADVLAETLASRYSQAAHIETQLADLKIVLGLSDMLSGRRDLQEVLDLTVRRVVEVMDVKACGIRLLNEETGELVVKAVCNLSDEYLHKGPVMLQHSDIDATAFAGETVYIENVPTDPRIRYPDNARREGIVSGLCVPMTYRGQTVGVLRVYTSQHHRFSDTEQTLLHSIGSQAASAIINSRLHKNKVRAEHVQRQVNAAREIQRRMLPSSAPQHSTLDLAGLCSPTLELGGDLYDFIHLPEGKLGVCIADVVGKGLPASLMMASARAALRVNAMSGERIDKVMSTLNRHMCRDTLVGEFVTAVYGFFSADASTFTYCNAGHPPPLVLRGDNFIELRTGGMVIGISADESFEYEVFPLRPNDLLVMMTDGVLEAMSFQEEEYGQQRFRASIWRHRTLDSEQLAHQLLWDVHRFAGLANQSDDITIVVARIGSQ